MTGKSRPDNIAGIDILRFPGLLPAIFPQMSKLELTQVRLDKWLWAARFYKTRTEATAAVAGGKVDLNGKSAKASRMVAVGDELEIHKTPYQYHLVITALADRRGSVEVAATLYQESEDSKQERERLAEQYRLSPRFDAARGKPSRRERDAWSRFRGR